MARKYKSKHTGQKIDQAVDNTDNNVIVLVGDTMQDGQGIERSLVSQKKIVRIIGAGGIRTFSNNSNGTSSGSVIVIDGSLIQAGTSPEQIAEVVRKWLNDHPEATTTVADESITMAKLAKAIKEKIILNLRGDDYSNGIPSITFDDSKNIIDILGAGGIKVYTSTQAGSKSIVIDASNVAGGYQKPSTGIPESDLAQAVKNKLNNPAFPEAPTDGKIYGRKSGAWTEITEQTYTALAKNYAEDSENSSIAAQEAADNAFANSEQARQSMDEAKAAKNAINTTAQQVQQVKTDVQEALKDAASNTPEAIAASIADLKQDIRRESADSMDEEEIYFETNSGDRVATFDSQGTHSKDYFYEEDGEEHSLIDKMNELKEALEEVNVEGLEKGETAETDEEITIEKENGEKVFSIGEDGVVHATDFVTKTGQSLSSSANGLAGKNMLVLGDSITQMFCNGDYNAPFSIVNNSGWGLRLAKSLGLASFKGRGLSGSTLTHPDGGFLVNKNTGATESTLGGFLNQTPTSSQVVARGAGATWSRITAQIPSAIKDSIDIVLVFLGHNDGGKDIVATSAEWIADHNRKSNESDADYMNRIDKEWFESSYFSQYNGDFNLRYFRGAIMSCAMKLQAWMPQAKIVFINCLSGFYTKSDANKHPEYALTIDSQQNKSNILLEVCRQISVPCIDLYGKCGINPMNRDMYMQDYIHPNTTLGQKKIAECLASELKNIVLL